MARAAAVRRMADGAAPPGRTLVMPSRERGCPGRPSGLPLLLAALGLLTACGDRSTIAAGACQIAMLDGENLIHTTLQVEMADELNYTVTNGVGSTSPAQVLVTLDAAGNAQFAYAAVPAVTREALIMDYAIQDNQQLTFLAVPDHPCTDFEKALIYFLVMEWFYFG
jgi:hypothetical protein